MLVLAAACGKGSGTAAQKHFTIGLFHVGVGHVPGSVPALVDALEGLGYLTAAQSEKFDADLKSLPRSLNEDAKRVTLEWRNCVDEAQADQVAKAFVQQKVDLIVALESQTIRAAHAATTTIPIVFLHSLDPVAEGLVKSLSHPGTNMTGLIGFRNLAGKQLEMFKNLVPSLHRVLAITDPVDPGSPALTDQIKATAATLHVEVLYRPASTEAAVRSIFGSLNPAEVDGVVIASQDLQTLFSDLMIKLSLDHHLPISVGFRQRVEEGGLFAYAPVFPVVGKSAATYVDKILRGASPADLPVETMTQLELDVNTKVAQELGIHLSPRWVDAADYVIDQITPPSPA
ncbi:MAG TPA: ABC transporter substrate-binding protein [Actinomycetota bacterium]